MDKLKDLWHELCTKYTNQKTILDELWAEIEKAYTSKGRYYHNLLHLEYMVDKAMKYQNELTDLNTLLFSIFYHDIVYSIKRKDNEERSADIAISRLTQLQVPTEKIMACKSQILATKDHTNHKDNDTNYLVDFDLAILGDSLENYKAYTKKIRREYSLYPSFLYNKGRKQVLQHFLAMDSIFKTATFKRKYERQAKENIKAELNWL